jgi:hypothetical protein
MEETKKKKKKKASTGNEECFTALCDTLKTKLFRTAKGILGDRKSVV